MKKEMFDLLFEKGLRLEGQPLFESQADLARVIHREVKPEEFSSEVSLKSYINRVLKGERPASDSLKNAILAAIELRIEDNEQIGSIRSQFLISLSEPVENKSENTTDKQAKEKFIEAIKSPGHHVFITDYPVEILTTSFSSEIKKTILTSVGLCKEKWPALKSPKSTFEYYVGDFDKAIRLWQELSDSLEEILIENGFKHDEAKTRLRDVCRKPYEYIQIFRSFPPIASHNLYLYNIEGTDEETIIFHLFRSKNDIKIIELPIESYANIRENVYSYLRGFLRDKDLIKEKYMDVALEVKKYGKINQFSNNK